MKIYTFYTDSHHELLNKFRLHFISESQSDKVPFIIKHFPQECATGEFLEDGWKTTMRRKVEYVLHALNETPEGEWFVHSDCDVLLFKGWDDIVESEQAKGLDMLIQDDYSMLCAGFFFCKSNDRTKKLWNDVLNNLDKFEHDQSAMNFFIKQSPNLKVGSLPMRYFTYGYFRKGTWDGEEFEVPEIENLKMFHANWTKGVKNKLLLMDKILKDKNR